MDPEYIYGRGGEYHVRIVFYWLPKTDILEFTWMAESSGGLGGLSSLPPTLGSTAGFVLLSMISHVRTYYLSLKKKSFTVDSRRL